MSESSIEAARIGLTTRMVRVQARQRLRLKPDDIAEIDKHLRTNERLMRQLPDSFFPETLASDGGFVREMRGVLDYGNQRAALADKDGTVLRVQGRHTICGNDGGPLSATFNRPTTNPLWVVGLLRGAVVTGEDDRVYSLLSTTKTAEQYPGIGRLARAVTRFRPIALTCALDDQQRLIYLSAESPNVLPTDYTLCFLQDEPTDGDWFGPTLRSPWFPGPSIAAGTIDP